MLLTPALDGTVRRVKAGGCRTIVAAGGEEVAVVVVKVHRMVGRRRFEAEGERMRLM